MIFKIASLLAVRAMRMLQFVLSSSF